jgi:hypothetical protein
MRPETPRYEETVMTDVPPSSGATVTSPPPPASAPPPPRRRSEPARSRDGQPPWLWQFVVAVALIVGFVALTVFMMVSADVSDGTWKNRLFVFSSVEAVVFTAVGWIFGREVHRAQAESAREDAETAKKDERQSREQAAQKAEEAAEARADGMRLAGAVETFAAGQAASGGRATDVGFGGDRPAASQLDELYQLARRLYG